MRITSEATPGQPSAGQSRRLKQRARDRGGSKRSRVHRFAMRGRVRLALVGLGSVLLALGLVGAGYEAVSARGDVERLAPTGRMVDVGGSLMHISCIGSGSPTVVLDAGLGGNSLDWSLVQPALGQATRVCSYDRPGMGWSEPVSGSRSPERIAQELHVLLTQAEIAPPYVLVGHSLAGKNLRMFALEHPEEVAGMVMVDARSEVVDEQASEGEVRMLRVAARIQGSAYRFARRTGIARLAGERLLGLSAFAADRDRAQVMALLMTSSDAVAASQAELTERSSSDEALKAAPALGDLPLIVLAADESMADIPFWTESQQAMSALSTRGSLMVVEGSSHYIHVDRPAVTIQAIHDVIAAARQRSETSPLGTSIKP